MYDAGFCYNGYRLIILNVQDYETVPVGDILSYILSAVPFLILI
jgi:hypothetical protein